MAIHAPITGAPVRASNIVLLRPAPLDSEAPAGAVVPISDIAAVMAGAPALPRATFEMLLERMIERLDEIDGDVDMEDDDPAGDPLDLGEMEDWRPEGVATARPLYGPDQSLGPINEREAYEAFLAQQREVRA